MSRKLKKKIVIKLGFSSANKTRPLLHFHNMPSNPISNAVSDFLSKKNKFLIFSRQVCVI